jgi:hypothetical protein
MLAALIALHGGREADAPPRARRLNATAKDASGARVGAAELPLVVTSGLALGEAAVRVRGGDAAALSKTLAFPAALERPLALPASATLEARPSCPGWLTQAFVLKCLGARRARALESARLSGLLTPPAPSYAQGCRHADLQAPAGASHSTGPACLRPSTQLGNANGAPDMWGLVAHCPATIMLRRATRAAPPRGRRHPPRRPGGAP